MKWCTRTAQSTSLFLERGGNMEFTEADLLTKLYNGVCKANVQIKFEGVKLEFSLNLLDDYNKPDCCIAHFGYGIFLRTEKGLKGEKYKTLDELKKDCCNKLRTQNIEPLSILINGVDFIQRIPLT